MTVGVAQLLRDLDGHVHTPHGWMRGARYDLLRKTLPEMNYPERASIPLLSDLSDEDLQAWYSAEAKKGGTVRLK
jgi:hypothetical protein